MDLRKLKKLIDLVEGSSITELEINDAEEKVRIVKNGGAIAHQAYAMSLATPVPLMSAAPGAAAAPPDEPEFPEGEMLKSPMVGTFYRASGPSAEPFVEIGSVVKAGDTLCIIEAMKLLNEIDADRAGTVVAILVENGEPVEYGEPLFIIG
ncbi:acetyl-CoA carboxylase biotin carboxyl carrier protein [Candidatus Accumulibacter sp. ACC003]|uniref:acetyl-CoA carboxylase biotin carboxyl carrier protein n=1 Tax=Candidatus Accumulibacter sp. ACC003 TaxID=2823334 RepID=UPI0025BFD8ED|nr:acetyl-CoA carboxylase biotin carboxyl carrier protein [Candidatus Accumulibacter sp. ACC003]